MMVHEGPRVPAQEPESLYKFITGIATRTSDRSLASLLGTAILGGAAWLLALPSLWPLSALAGTLGTISLWGLLAHRIATHPSRLLLLTQRLLVALGTLLTAAAGFAIYFGMLGPRWML